MDIQPAQELGEALKSNSKVDDISTLAILLGPYRNLTTLISSVFALHPEIQVLNHAGQRVFSLPEINFFSSYSTQRFDDFLRYALYISQGGKRGMYGGSILHSHAFVNNPEIRQAYTERYGESKVAESVGCILWKEPMLVTQLIQQNNIDLVALASTESRLRFLLPVRNPFDCAFSHLQTGSMAAYFGEPGRVSVEQILEGILQIIVWFVDMMQRCPQQFMLIDQHALSHITSPEVTDFLAVSNDSIWEKTVQQVVHVKPSYPVDNALRNFYIKRIDQYFSTKPEIADLLLAYAR